jgi:hypothetical protein
MLPQRQRRSQGVLERKVCRDHILSAVGSTNPKCLQFCLTNTVSGEYAYLVSKRNPLSAAKIALKPALAPEDFRVYIFGPALGDGRVRKPPANGCLTAGAQIRHAKYLRQATRTALENDGFTVDFGESQDVLSFWSDLFAQNPATAETLHADQLCNAIVIFPASIGSIAELALFACDMSLAVKTMAVVHSGRNSDTSFFRLGLIELFKTYSGRVEFLDYGDHDACVGYAVRYVKGLYQRFLRDVRIVGNITRRHRGTLNERTINENKF